MADLISRLVMTTDGWTGPIQSAKQQLTDLDATTSKAIGSIRNAMNSTKQGPIASLMEAKTSIIDVGNQWNSFLSNTKGVESNGEAATYLVSTIRSSVRSFQDAGAAIGSLNQTQTKAATTTKQTGTDFSAVNQIVTRSAIGYIAYKVALEDVISASRKHVSANSELRKATGGVVSSVYELTGTLTGAFTNGVKASFMAVVQLATGFDSMESMIDAGAATVTSWANTATTAIKGVTAQAKDLALIGSTALAVFHGADASAFYEEGQALEAVAAETTRVIALQEQQRSTLGFIRGAAEAAAAAQAQSAEVARIGTLMTVEALDEELKLLLQKEMTQGKAVTSSKAWQQQITQITAAIEKQKAAIEGGTAKPKDSAADVALKAQADALYRVQFGADAAAVAAFRLTGATDEQVAAFKASQAAINEAKAAEEAFQRQSQEATAAFDAQARMQEQGAQTIRNLKDEIDELTGAATKAEIAARNMMAQGYDAAQAEEVAKLTEQLEQLKGEKKPDKAGAAGKDAENSAVLKGSAKAAELIVGAGKGGGEKEQLAKQTLDVQKQLLTRMDKGLTLEVEEVHI